MERCHLGPRDQEQQLHLIAIPNTVLKQARLECAAEDKPPMRFKAERTGLHKLGPVVGKEGRNDECDWNAGDANQCFLPSPSASWCLTRTVCACRAPLLLPSHLSMPSAGTL